MSPVPPTPTRRSARERLLRLVVPVLLGWQLPTDRTSSPPEEGQSTVEYALVLLGAAAVALALVAWVTRSDAISRLFDSVVGRILSQA
jgi:hypothetical protein